MNLSLDMNLTEVVKWSRNWRYIEQLRLNIHKWIMVLEYK